MNLLSFVSNLLYFAVVRGVFSHPVLASFYVSLTQAKRHWGRSALGEEMSLPTELVGKPVWYFLNDCCGWPIPQTCHL